MTTATTKRGRATDGPARKQSRTPDTISIVAVVDVVGSLATRSLGGNLYLYDTNKPEGSTGLGTEELHTSVRKGDQILWTVFSLECETFVRIADVSIAEDICRPERRTYPGTDVTYWVGTVTKDLTELVPYQISLTVGARPEPMLAPKSSALIGAGAGTR
jgi:hypothetical protein